MYQTSPEPPATVVSKLFHKHSSDSVHLGDYTVDDNKVKTLLLFLCTCS